MTQTNRPPLVATADAAPRSIPESLDTIDQLGALAELDRLFAQHGLPYWLFGGWAVDFHAGRVTREHSDIDIAIWADDRMRLAALLVDAAWIHRPETAEDGYTCYSRLGVRLEVAFLARDARGRVYTPLRNGRGEWPHESFGNAEASLDGVHAHLVSLDSLIADKSAERADPGIAAKDRADIASLLRRG